MNIASTVAPLMERTGKVVGEKEFFGPNQVKITWINGVGNGEEGCKSSAFLVNQVFQNAKVHFFHNPSDGLYSDLKRAAHHFYGGECAEAKELAAHLKEVLKTAKKVIHVAHSHGGIITSRAVEHLTPQERSRIDVVVIGSPVLIPEGAFASVRHYVSDRDYVPSCHKEISEIMCKKKSNSTVVVLPGDTSVYLDHEFSGKTYQQALKAYAEEYAASDKPIPEPEPEKGCWTRLTSWLFGS